MWLNFTQLRNLFLDLSFVTFSSTSSRKSSQNRLSRNLSTTFVNNNSVRALGMYISLIYYSLYIKVYNYQLNKF